MSVSTKERAYEKGRPLWRGSTGQTLITSNYRLNKHLRRKNKGWSVGILEVKETPSPVLSCVFMKRLVKQENVMLWWIKYFCFSLIKQTKCLQSFSGPARYKLFASKLSAVHPPRKQSKFLKGHYKLLNWGSAKKL